MSQKWNTNSRYLAIGLILVFLVFVGWQIRAIFEPLIIAGLIAYIIYPFVQVFQTRFGLKPAVASRIVYFFALALMITAPVLLAPTLARQAQAVALDLLKTFDEVETILAEPVHIAGFTIHLEGLIPDARNSFSSALETLPEDALALLETTSVGTLWFLVIVVCVYYFMTDWDKLRDWIISLAPVNYQHDLWRLYREIKTIWISYLRSQLTLMIIVAITFSIIWSIIGLPGALVLGLLAGLFSLIPDVGPFAATVLALIVALLEGSDWTWMPQNNLIFALIVAGLYVVLINIKNIWLRPMIYGRSVHMHEGVVFVAIIAAVVFTGIVGAFIVVPVLASLSIIGRYLHARILGLPAFEDEVIASFPSPDPEPASPAPAEAPKRKSPARKKSSR